MFLGNYILFDPFELKQKKLLRITPSFLENNTNNKGQHKVVQSCLSCLNESNPDSLNKTNGFRDKKVSGSNST